MTKALFLVAITSGMLLAQSNVVSGNNIDTNGGNVTIAQSNSNVSEEEIKINQKIDENYKKVISSSMDQQSKNMLTGILSESKTINQKKIPLVEKNRECKFKAEFGAKLMKFVNVKLLFSYCDGIF